MDAKHDKHERLVKLSRDCTIHSKRTIFLLHRNTSNGRGKKSSDSVLNEAAMRLKEGAQILKNIAKELESEMDPLKFHSAYTSGIQEYMEALSFYVFLKDRRLITPDEAKTWMTFPLSQKAGELTANTEDYSNEVKPSKEILQFPLSNSDYLLGVADLTGELMRLCINATGNGDLDQPFFIVQVMRDIYCCYLNLGHTSVKELPRKLKTLRNSLFKIENVCYNIKVRGSEVPNKLLVDMLSKQSVTGGEDDDPI